jgi:hypothetical protein
MFSGIHLECSPEKERGKKMWKNCFLNLVLIEWVKNMPGEEIRGNKRDTVFEKIILVIFL